MRHHSFSHIYIHIYCNAIGIWNVDTAKFSSWCCNYINNVFHSHVDTVWCLSLSQLLTFCWDALFWDTSVVFVRSEFKLFSFNKSTNETTSSSIATFARQFYTNIQRPQCFKWDNVFVNRKTNILDKYTETMLWMDLPNKQTVALDRSSNMKLPTHSSSYDCLMWSFTPALLPVHCTIIIIIIIMISIIFILFKTLGTFNP